MKINLKAAGITLLILLVIVGFIYSLLFYSSIMVTIGIWVFGVVMVVCIFNLVKIDLLSRSDRQSNLRIFNYEKKQKRTT
jgi:fatty acid desaturase